MNKRIKELRKELKMTQQAFADGINVSKSAIESYEYRNVAMSDRTIKDICRVYHVNENWLRTGEGEMFQERTRETEIAEITAELFKAEDTNIRYQLMRLIHQVDDDELEAIFKAAEAWVDGVREAGEIE